MSNSLTDLWWACGVSLPECEADIEAGEILVYLLQLNRGSLHAVWPFLSKDEKTRVAKYGRERDGLRFAISRALLRGVLSLHTDCIPSRLVFHYGLRGRPYLEPNQANGLDFNLARREDCCAIVLGLDRRVGIDIESYYSATLIEPIKAMLPVEDRAAIETVNGSVRNMQLIFAWTALEARAKANGTMLDEEAMFNSELRCRYFELSGGWIGCVAANGRNLQIKLILQEDCHLNG